MKILVLGGSHFVGRALVEVAIEAGHEVTTLNRGISGHHVNGAKLIRADRTNHDELASVVADRSWDSVVDTWSGPPNHATFAAQTLGPHTGHYAYVSSRSVYTLSAPPDSRRCLGSSPELSRRWSPELSRSCGVWTSGGLGVRVVGSLTY